MKVKWKKIKFIIAFILLVIIGIKITASAHTNNYYDKKEDIKNHNNINVNIKQPSIYIFEDGYIYYVSLEDWKIYSVNLKNGIRENIYNEKVCEEGLLLCGNYLYFKNRNDNRMYRIEKNKANLEKISEEELGRGYEGFLSVNDEVIYYDTNSMPHKIGSVSLSNNENEFYKRISLSSKYNSGFLYSYSNEGLKSYDIKYEKECKLLDSCIYNIVYIDNRFIYYISYSDYKLYKVSVDGKENSLVVNDKVILSGPDFDYGNVEFFNDSIYYISYDMPNKPVLYCTSLTDSKKTVIKENAVDFRIYEKGLYYVSSDEGAKLHNLNIDNFHDRVVDSRTVAYLAGSQADNIVYSIKYDSSNAFGQLYAVDLLGRKIELK